MKAAKGYKPFAIERITKGFALKLIRAKKTTIML